MNYAGENLQTIDNARARSGKVSIRIDDADSSVLCGWKRIESRKSSQQLVVVPRTIDIVPAKRQDDDLGPCVQYCFPSDLDRRLMFSS